MGLGLLMSCRLTWALQNEGVPSRPGGLSHSGTSISTVLISRMICWTGGNGWTGSTGGDASACWSVICSACRFMSETALRCVSGFRLEASWPSGSAHRPHLSWRASGSNFPKLLSFEYLLTADAKPRRNNSRFRSVPFGKTTLARVGAYLSSCWPRIRVSTAARSGPSGMMNRHWPLLRSAQSSPTVASRGSRRCSNGLHPCTPPPVSGRHSAGPQSPGRTCPKPFAARRTLGPTCSRFRTQNLTASSWSKNTAQSNSSPSLFSSPTNGK